VCGGARLVHVAFEQAPAIREQLTLATRNNRGSRVLRTVSALGGLFAAVLVLLALLVRALVNPSTATFAAISVIPILAVVTTLFAFSRAKTLRNRTASALEQAQAMALANVLVDFPEGAVASQLASLLQISHTRAEQLLTRLNVRDDIESIVADDGQLLFRIRGAVERPFSPTGERLRVPTNATVDTSDTDISGDESKKQSPQKVHGE
jgi:hypothetical protein